MRELIFAFSFTLFVRRSSLLHINCWTCSLLVLTRLFIGSLLLSRPTLMAGGSLGRVLTLVVYERWRGLWQVNEIRMPICWRGCINEIRRTDSLICKSLRAKVNASSLIYHTQAKTDQAYPNYLFTTMLKLLMNVRETFMRDILSSWWESFRGLLWKNQRTCICLSQ